MEELFLENSEITFSSDQGISFYTENYFVLDISMQNGKYQINLSEMSFKTEIVSDGSLAQPSS